jgi:ubiquinone biosynthesis protein
MHPGNCSSMRQGRHRRRRFRHLWAARQKERRFLAEILYGFIRRDYLRVAEVHFEAGYVPLAHVAEDFAQAIRAIGEPIHGQPAETSRWRSC